jgi:hypothetical protein
MEVPDTVKRSQGTGTSAGMAKPPKFDRITSRPMFKHQFKIVAEHSCWTHLEKST